jgi:hypothetical protein
MFTGQIREFIHRSWNSGHDFMYFEYFGSVVLFTRLGKFEFLFTVSEMLPYFDFDWCTAYGIIFSPHFTPFFQYICICYFRLGNAGCAVNRVLPLDEFRQYIFVSVRIIICHILVQLFAYGAMASFDDRVCYVRISTHLELNTLLL